MATRNCTIKDAFETLAVDRLGWVPSPPQRGTIDILYSSSLVLIISVWTVLHPNIPARSDGAGRIAQSKAIWSALGIVAPEMLTLFAATQWGAAKSCVADMKELSHGDWTMVHAFYANAGGFLLDAPDYPAFPINSKAIHYLCANGWIECPRLSREDVWDRSKADVFAKTCALAQVGWLLLQTVARAVQGLAVTPFELFTIAFVVPTMATAFFWANKPQNVNEPTVIRIDRPIASILRSAGPAVDAAWPGKPPMPWADTPLDFVEKPNWDGWGRRPFWRYFGGLQRRPIQRIPDDYLVLPPTTMQSLIVWVVSVIHASVHVAGWSFSFATPVETMIWRCSSLVLLGFMFTGGLVPVMSTQPWFNFKFSLFWVWIQNPRAANPTFLHMYLLAVISEFAYVLCILARILILFEVFVSFRAMPATAYVVVDWSAFLPHVI